MKIIDNRKEKVATQKKQWIRLTSVCNNQCVFCLDKEAQDGSYVPLEKINKELIQGIKENIRRVVLSGGEPTLHPQFLEIIKLAKNLRYQHIQIITNGRMFAYKIFLDSVVKTGVDEITFSMHGHNEELHDKQTQVKGSFNQALTGLMNALKIANLIVNIDVVINKFNVKYLADILKFFINLGVSEFDLLQVIPFGRAWDYRDSVFYNIDESFIYLKRAFQLSKNPNLHLWTNRFPAKYLEGFEDLIQHPFKLYDEIRGRKEMFDYFLNNGEKLSCMGERCRYCILEGFCKDLIQFKKEGKLVSRSIPFCLGKAKDSRFVKSYKKYILNNNTGNKINIFKLLDFYIKHRYFIKGLKCDICKFNKDCDGAQCDHVRKYGFVALTPFTDKNLDIFLDVPITCDLKCIFCSRSLDEHKRNNSVFELKKIEACLLEAYQKFKIKRLRIGGTEPLNYIDIAKVIKYAKEIGFKDISLATSGIKLVDKQLVDILITSGLRKVELPIYGHNSSIHDSITGVRGSFKNLLEGINNLRQYPAVEIILHTLLLKQNYSFIPHLYDFVTNSLKIYDFRYLQVSPRNDNPKDYFNYCPTYTQISHLLENNPVMNVEFDIPFCTLPKFYLQKLFLKITNGAFCEPQLSPLDRLMVNILENGIFFRKNVEQIYKREKMTKPLQCKECKLNNLCKGVFELYLEIYGDKELVSITSFPLDIHMPIDKI